MASRKILLFDKEGNPQHLLGNGTTVPVRQTVRTDSGRIILLIDCSGSMSGNKIQQARDGARSFAERAFSDSNEVGLVCFSGMARLLLTPTKDEGSINEALEVMNTGGSTNMADGIHVAARTLGEKGKRIITLVTDGQPDSKDGAIQAAEEAKDGGCDILCIGVDGADLEFLKLIASLDDLALHSSGSELKETLIASYDSVRLLTRKR